MPRGTWSELELNSITTKIGSGATPRGGKSSYKGSGIALIRSLNVYDLQFSCDGLAFIDDDQAERLSNVEVQRRDILLNITGASVARCCMVPSSILPARVNQHVSIVRVDPSVADAGFILRCMVSPRYKHHLLTLAQGGATREALTQDTIRHFPVRVPPLPTQRKIAAILSAYDDLIENNNRRIKVLEEMARRIYREWFVHFRFPGHEDVAMVDSELGPVPEGWEVVPIGEVIETLGGGTPSTKKPEYWIGGSVSWYSPSDLTSAGTMFVSESGRHITQLGLGKSSAKMFPEQSVMMTSRATVGVVAINTTPACTNQGFITCVPNDRLSVYLIYFWLLENRELIISLASGATFREINKTTFRSIATIVPDEAVHREFQSQVGPIADQIRNSIARNRLLKCSRDLLLPRLISGEVDVSELDIDTLRLEALAAEV